MMDFIFDGSKYECICCGRCCTRLNVPVSDDDVSKLLGKDVSGAGNVDGSFFKKLKGSRFLAKNDDGTCRFLRDNKCLIHMDLGMDYKPQICSQFPVFFTDTPDGTYVGLSYFCPASVDGVGSQLTTERVKDVYLQVKNVVKVGESLELGGKPMSWDAYKVLEEKIANLFSLSESVAGWLKSLDLLVSHVAENTGSKKELLELDERKFAGAELEDPNFQSKSNMLSYIIISSNAGGNIISSTKMAVTYYLHFSSAKKPLKYWFFENPVLGADVYGVSFRENETLKRYFRHLVFRKELAKGDVLNKTKLLILAYGVIKWYSQASALSVGRRQVQDSDIADAISFAEKNMILHANQSASSLSGTLRPIILHEMRSRDFVDSMLSDKAV